MEKEDKYLFKNDLLHRYAYARRIKGILEESENEYMRCNDGDSFVMAVSGSWGSGKTHFMKMLALYLAGKQEWLEDKKGYEPYTNENQIVFFDAWENDLYDDPVIPLFKALATALFPDSITNDMTKKELEASYEGLKKAAGGIFKQSVVDIVGGLKEASEATKKVNADAYLDDLSKKGGNHEAQKLREKLTEAAKDKKIVVIVDEVDRCKPTFAMKLLEAVKHLFNVKGIKYIFSLDISQLRHTINNVYGDRFDSVGYLERFFDVTSYIPEVSLRKILDKSLEKAGLGDLTRDMKGRMYLTCHELELSVREIQQVTILFSLLYKERIKEYHSDHATLLYFYFVALRYKHPFEFENACLQEDRTVAKELIGKYQPYPGDEEASRICAETLMENSVIAARYYYKYQTRGGSGDEPERFKFPQPLLEGEKLSETQKKKIALKEGETINYVIYQYDIEHIEAIGAWELLRYILRNLELCDVDEMVLKE